MKTKSSAHIQTYLISLLLFIGLSAGLLAGCQPAAQASPVTPTPQLPDEIVLYNWVDDMPEKALEAFTREFGVAVRYETYESQEEAIANLEAGQVYDVVVMDNRHIPGLINNNRLAVLNQLNIPNLANISADFRDRAFDRGNRYSAPYNWGSTGLVVRSDKVQNPVTSWSDLWKQDKTGKVVMWKGLRREMIGAALKSLGYSANSEKEQELQAAMQHLEELLPNLIFVEDYGPELETSSPILTVGNGVIAVGWSLDAVEGQKDLPAITYVLPDEGALLWGDNFVIPANSPNRFAAELFINFMLRPEISALVTNENAYATGNEQAAKYISAEILNNPYIFPPIEVVRKAETILPINPETEQLQEAFWTRFIGEQE